jgi:hypothetical protein
MRILPASPQPFWSARLAFNTRTKEEVMSATSKFKDVEKFLDTTAEYTNTFAEVNVNGQRLLVVTQVGEIDGGQTVFSFADDAWKPVESDTFVDVTTNEAARSMAATAGTCGKSSDADHATIAAAIKAQVNVFSSANGPDGGNLACVWAVRKIVKAALARSITETDGTSVFGAELQRCFGSTSEDNEVPAGAIIISPTETRPDGSRNIGHVGLLGPGGAGLDRLIYSNSSRRARWEQNHTLGSWIANYRDRKGLKVRFYPLPLRGGTVTG